MDKKLQVTLKVDAKTGQVTAVKNSFDDLDKSVGQTDSSLGKFKTTLLGMASITAVIYGLFKAFEMTKSAVTELLSVSGEFEQYKNRMSAFTNSVEDTSTELARAKQFALDYKLIIADTTQTLIMMKNYGLRDTNEQLKIYSNTAKGAGKSVEQFAEAMADALTGENERLKEFGVKASAQGEKIAYAWSDSSGKARNIVISNNKDIIDSTLSAIFNEKYVGQLELYANSWEGLMQGLSNQWTAFKLDVADEGLLSYFKAFVQTVSGMLGSMFEYGKGAAAGFTQTVISGIETMVSGVGFLYDAWHGIGAAFEATKLVFFGLVASIGEGINLIAKGWELLWVGAKNVFKSVVDGVGIGFTTMANSVLGSINTIANGLLSLGSGALDMMGIDIQPINLKVDAYVSSIDTAVASTSNLMNMDWSMANAKSAYAAVDEHVDNIGKGAEKASEFISQLNENYRNIDAQNSNVKTQKDAAKSALDAIGAGYGGAGEAVKNASKAGKAAGKAAKSAGKALKAEMVKSAEEANKEIAIDFADQFKGVFESLFKGDLLGAIKGFMDGISMDLLKAPIDKMSKWLGDSVNGLFEGLGDWGSLLGGGLMAIAGSFIGDLFSSEISQAKIDSYKGRTDLSDESIVNLSAMLENVENPLLPYTKMMTDYLNGIQKNTFELAKAFNVTAGVNLTGSNFIETSSASLWGSDSTSLIDSKLRLSEINLYGGMSAQIIQDVLKQSTSWFGLVSKTSVTTYISGVGAELNHYINNIMVQGKDFIVSASETLGYDVARAISAYRATVEDISFEGLSPEEVEVRLNQVWSEVFSGAIDSLNGVSDLVDKYIESGENSMEALGRLAYTFEQSAHQLDLIGESLMSVDSTLAAVAGAGGLESFNSAMSSYMSNFFTEQEQYEMQLKSLSVSFDSLGLDLPTTNDGFKTLLEGIDTTTDEGATLYGQLINLAESFNMATEAGLAITESESGLSSERLESIKKYQDFMLGQYSNLNIVQKVEYANNMSYTPDDAEDTALLALKTAYKYATTEQDYRKEAIRYEKILRDKTKTNSTLTDVTDAIELTNNKLKDLDEKMEKLSNDNENELKMSSKQSEELRKSNQLLGSIAKSSKEQARSA